MNRYDHALGRIPEKRDNGKIVTFGIDDDITKSIKKRYRYFRPSDQQKRIGILFKVNENFFFSAHAHYHRSTGYVLCDSNDEKAECCDIFPKRSRRIACVVIRYCQDLHHEILPWVFGHKIFENLKTSHKMFSLKENDIVVSSSRGRGLYPNYSMMTAGPSQWVHLKDKDVYLSKFNEYRDNMRPIIGREFSDIDEDLLEQVYNDTQRV